MRLTAAFSRITALFNTHHDEVREESDTSLPSVRVYFFQVGIFQYRVRFSPDPYQDGVYDTAFILWSVGGTPEERHRFWSKVFKHPVTKQEMEQYSQPGKIPFRVRYGVNYAGSSGQVFSGVIQIIRKFWSENPHVRCIQFTADLGEESRISLYRALIRRFFSGYRVLEKRLDEDQQFTICRPENPEISEATEESL